MNDNGIDGYRTYLARRDGEADLLNRRLSSREEFFAALEADSVRSAHRVDRQVFARNLRRRRPESGVDRQLLFLLATAKLNQAERFGVGLGETYGHNSGDDKIAPVLGRKAVCVLYFFPPFQRRCELTCATSYPRNRAP